jgi:hypothetical protein
MVMAMVMSIVMVWIWVGDMFMYRVGQGKS